MTYSLDLINRVVNYYNSNLTSFRAVSKIFLVSKSIVGLWLKQKPKKYLNNQIIIKKSYCDFIKHSLDHNPFQTQEQLKIKLNKKFNINMSINIVKKILSEIKYTKKKYQENCIIII